MTEVLRVDRDRPDESVILRAARCLRGGGLVAFPTETVYGLGVYALDRQAILRVFAAKERPANDPLIIHVATVDEAVPLVADMPRAARELAARFWPGPLTIVLRRSSAVPDEITAGRETVAIRIPSHPVARALLIAARLPVAAPSANLFSRPSPTRATHVLADLDGRIDMILDAGPSDVGLESTVVDLVAAPPAVLRPGSIGIDALREVQPDMISRNSLASGDVPMRSPGLLQKHYSPRTPMVFHGGDRDSALRLLKHTALEQIDRGKSVGVLAYVEDLAQLRGLPVRIVELGSEWNLAAVGARLYVALRECDELGVDVVLARSSTTSGALSHAIDDRLMRAAGGHIVIRPDMSS